MKTNTELRLDVEAELSWQPSVDNSDIVVGVQDGIVTLAGNVPSYAHKWAAERATKSIAGVRAIANELNVKPIATSARSDKDIAQAAIGALQAHMSVPASDITVLVSDGWVTLEGKVAMWYQKQAAENAVRDLWGIKGVVNSIGLKVRAYAGDIKGKIHQAYKRHADLDADKVRVSVVDGTVILAGEVASWHERDDAETAAWAAPGVTSVKNDLLVSL